MEDVLKKFSRIQLATVNAEEVPEIAGYVMAFTVPVLVLYYEGKEILREARIVHIEKLQENIRKIYESI